MLIYIIADYGRGDLAFAEVVQRMKLHLPDAEPIFVPVPSFSTLAAGFCIAQLGLNAAPPSTLIYHNVAPRKDDLTARAGNAGERLAYARLSTGVRVIGINAGYALSFIKDLAEKLRWAAAPEEGSQFRSRDIFPQAVAAIALGDPMALGEDIDARTVLTPPPSAIVYIDGYGNLKTSLPFDAKNVRLGTHFTLRIEGDEHKAILSDGVFAVNHGELAFAPGSGGWPLPHGGEVRWMEIFLRGGSAWDLFGRPTVGSHISLIND